MAFVIPDGLDESLYGLAWMVGSWGGTGHGEDAEGEFEFEQTLDIAFSDGPYLHYLAQVFDVDTEGKRVRVRSMESGFWRADGKGSVEAFMTHPEGYAELWVGKIEGAKIELVTDGVMRSHDAKTTYTGGQRLYGQVEGDLLWTYDRATEEHQLKPYMWARLTRTKMADGRTPDQVPEVS